MKSFARKFLFCLLIVCCNCGNNNKNVSLHESLPIGERGVYLGMGEAELKKQNFSLAFAYNEGGYIVYKSDTFFPGRSTLFEISQATGRLQSFWYMFPCRQDNEEIFRSLVNKYEKLYGEKKRYPLGETYIEAYQWKDNQASLILVYFHGSPCMMTKKYSLPSATKN